MLPTGKCVGSFITNLAQAPYAAVVVPTIALPHKSASSNATMSSAYPNGPIMPYDVPLQNATRFSILFIGNTVSCMHEGR